MTTITGARPRHLEATPAARWEYGSLSANGHHGALVFEDLGAERGVVTHHTWYGRVAISPTDPAITRKREGTP
ncbi:hypothetical protein [Streptomyces bluensis]|uniref:Uncharacterized protein n=1 Tax=Streptomyces bluensis TaxID=33897 RepID=A0ABW6UHZ3_9ACTN